MHALLQIKVAVALSVDCQCIKVDSYIQCKECRWIVGFHLLSSIIANQYAAILCNT